MNSASLRRPLGCLKASLRNARQQRSLQRFMATETSSAVTPSASSSSTLPPHTFYGIRKGRRSNDYRTGFAVYSRPLPRPTTSDPLKVLHDQQIAAMDPTGARARLFDRHSPDSAKVGDVMMVTTRRAAEPFSGVCISIRRAGIDTAILLRTALTKVGVEMWFKIFSRNVVAIDLVQRRTKRARRARLTYMRKPEHDAGSVDQIVMAWRKSRNVLRSKTGSPLQARSKKGAKKK